MPTPAKRRLSRLLAAIVSFGPLGLLSAVSCSTAPAPAKVVDASAAAPARPVIDQATELFYAGKESALEGDFACAEASFQQALDSVAPEGTSADGSPEVQ